MREAVEHIEQEIANLRSIITELRPAALDELGLRTAIEALLDRHREQSGFEIAASLRCRVPKGAATDEISRPPSTGSCRRRSPTSPSTHAPTWCVAVTESDGELLIEVQDDGAGFDPDLATEGFGLAGMRERVALAGGTLRSTPASTARC